MYFYFFKHFKPHYILLDVFIYFKKEKVIFIIIIFLL